MKHDALEATANTVLGLLIGWAILRAYGMSGTTALAAQATFVAASWVRVFAIRRVMRRATR